MPFGALERPSLALGLLTAHCRRLGIGCATRYLTFAYADRVGLGDYSWIASDQVPYTAFAGDWLFAEALYGARPYADAAYVDEVLRRQWQLSDADVARLERMRGHVEPFLEACLRDVPWGEYTLIGFTSVFQQNIPSLALGARVKRAFPAVTIAFGGANWEEAMGVALQERFPFVDLAFSGEADGSFPAVLEARARGDDVTSIPGVSTAAKAVRPEPAGSAARVHDLDTVPWPDYDAYFAQRRFSCAAALEPTLLAETARGCWWGERSHCTFCGLNGATMAFRSKTPERVLEEMRYLRDRYDTTSFSMVDDILDLRYFRSVLPALAEAELGIEFFWEVKANLTREQVRQLRDAGVIYIQPGIESLSDHVLKLMRKGVSAFRNIELLKWCREYGVKPYWNFLYGFPGETAEDYEQQVALIGALRHLDPPTGYGPIRLDRFSPYHAEPASFGMVSVRPMTPFTYLYPFPRDELMRIAYYFEFDYGDGRDADAYAYEAVGVVREWMAEGARGAVELHSGDDGSEIELIDTRDPGARRARLRGWKAAVYLACDRAQSLRQLEQLPEAEGVSADELRGFLERCVQHRLMVANQRSWLAVAVHVPPRADVPTALAGAPLARAGRISEPHLNGSM
jgi:ribosomal peptide maturation radical SAM protein 1